MRRSAGTNVTLRSLQVMHNLHSDWLGDTQGPSNCPTYRWSISTSCTCALHLDILLASDLIFISLALLFPAVVALWGTGQPGGQWHGPDRRRSNSLRCRLFLEISGVLLLVYPAFCWFDFVILQWQKQRHLHGIAELLSFTEYPMQAVTIHMHPIPTLVYQLQVNCSFALFYGAVIWFPSR